jgi:hypothetical protein
MNTPGFTAEASLSKRSEHYQTERDVTDSSTQMIGAIYLAAPGQDFPNHTCTCKGCAGGGGDLTGQCASVCKDKEVYAKGSESHDYCKAAFVQPPIDVFWWARGGLPTLALP